MICELCKNEVDILDKHHLIPKSQGGLNTKENIIKICKDCHYKLHHPDYEEGDIDQFNEEYNESISNDIFSDGWGIIPNKIARDSSLSPGAKILYAEISSLCASKGYCWASNTYFSKLFKVSNATVSNWMTQLEKYLRFENRTSNKRKIRVHTLNKSANPKQPSKKLEGNPQKNLKVPSKKLEGNNSINKSNKIINNNIVETIITYLNEKAKKKYKSNTQKTKSLINARIKEGFSLEDFKKVVDVKCSHWINNQEMNIYLRPETLFGTKFEGYLNQNEIKKNKSYEEEYLKNHGDELDNLG